MAGVPAGVSGGLPQAVCLGESMAVLLPDGPGPLDTVPGFRSAVGGAESNTACVLAGLGVPSAWISRVGADGFGRRLLTELSGRGVDVSAVTVDSHRPTGLYVKEVGGSAHPQDLGAGGSRLHYYRTGSAASALSPALLAEPSAARLLAGTRLLHLSGITAALSDGCLALVRALLAAPRAGRTVSFDLNWRPALWRDRDPAVLRELLDAADVVLLGADEGEAALGTGDPTAIRRLLPRPRAIVLKDAARQALSVARDGAVVRQPALRVEVVEPTGAGDAFAGGYLAGLLRGLGEPGRLRLGHLAAACALTSPGDQGVTPEPAAVDALLSATDAAWAATVVTASGVSSGAAARSAAPGVPKEEP